MAKTQTKAPAEQTKAKPTPAPAPEKRAQPNRYLRASRVILREGVSIDPVALGMAADMSAATAAHCLSAFSGVCEALREAKLLPGKVVPARAPVAPTAAREAEPETVTA
jgi:hypothetical protein